LTGNLLAKCDNKKGFDKMKKNIAIIGAGNGGQAFAGYFSLQGHDVRIFDVSEKTIETINDLGGIQIEGNSSVTGFGKVLLASTSMEDVIKGAELVFLVLPSIYHSKMAEQMAPYLEDGQYVVLNPMAPLGAVEFKSVLDMFGCKADIKIVCTATLLFACRADRVGHVNIGGQKVSYTACTYPSCYNYEAAEVFRDVLPELVFCDDIIRISLDNLNAIVHPGPTILNTGRIESNIPYQYYLDFTPGQGKIAEALDRERMKIGEAFGLNIRTFVDEFKTMYQVEGDTIHEVLRNNVGYKGLMGQNTLDSRYLREDVPYSLVAFQTLAKIAGIEIPTIDAVVTIARDLIKGLDEGRTSNNLGLGNVTKKEFIQMCRG